LSPLFTTTKNKIVRRNSNRPIRRNILIIGLCALLAVMISYALQLYSVKSRDISPSSLETLPRQEKETNILNTQIGEEILPNNLIPDQTENKSVSAALEEYPQNPQNNNVAINQNGKPASTDISPESELIYEEVSDRPDQWLSVGDDYFDDAVFIGDSISTGIKLYGIMDNAYVFAGTGIRLENILEKEIAKIDGVEMNLIDALAKIRPKKIYIMMGANSLGAANDAVLNLYEWVIENIMDTNEESIVYVQSVLPLYEPVFWQKYSKNITNEKIESFNAGLVEVARKKGAVYLDVADVFRESDGSMPKEYTPDGIHINPPQYFMWFDYLKAHTVAEQATEENN
jgi:lysophospholipase L1-like esterase